jgi:hypothetical protein
MRWCLLVGVADRGTLELYIGLVVGFPLGATVGLLVGLFLEQNDGWSEGKADGDPRWTI